MNKTVYILLFLYITSLNFAHAFDLDMTVDDEIRKNYNSTKLIQDTKINESSDLPELPSITKQNRYNNTQTTQKPTPRQTINYPISNQGNIKISQGTSFNVINVNKISDWQTKGTTVRFKTKAPIIKRKYTIPTGTEFIGEIIESHQPQISCNGGLVVIRIRSMLYNGQTVPLNAYVTKADSKHIFLNNIKGDRTYLKTMWKKGNWGRTLFNKMLTLTVNLGSEGATLVLSPFPFAYGTLCLGLNTITSPICAFFSKGGHVSINSGSEFRIKLLDDTYIN